MDRFASLAIWPFVFSLASGPADGQARATKLLALKLLPEDSGFIAVLQADGVMEHRIVEEQNPQERLVLDVLGVSNPLRHYYPENHPFLERVLMYEYPPATNPSGTGPLARIVFELKRNVGYQVKSQATELHVTFSEGAGRKAPAPVPVAPAKVSAPEAPVVPVEKDNGDVTPEAAPEVYDPSYRQGLPSSRPTFR